ncbi:MAG: hypothetical protein E5Y10_10625 [Mesorhizobium sp.]|nr:MAG: hypothetical protein EOS13_06305 [Mesorhizobium sp.]TIN24873.1 MAG: hypothetical protein E5Y19_21005 [Mesorhizobium sp.]TIN40445.1 MAG: hypothetical protein E5Y13_10125 [Mesorhizobium sp.]TJU77590.1 MAG: hypothetical protein E5Y15_26805 [Mesorhizobium sp.]TJU90987.1 MAG: hypothetical protein E5Y10_10625 [Mesorhizobium sp.]
MFSNVCAAPHLPAGILSPYSDGERGAVTMISPISGRCRNVCHRCGQPLLPVTIRGEVPGRAMRGSAEINNWWVASAGNYIQAGTT